MQDRTQSPARVAPASKRRAGRTALLLLLAAASLSSTPGFAAEPAPPTLVVTATGDVSAIPDLALVTAGVVAEGRTTATALAEADRAAAALLREVEAAGIAKADVATVDFSVRPNWSQRTGTNPPPAHIVGYTVENTFRVKVRRLADLGPLVERLVETGSNSVSGIAFDVSDADRRRDEARVAAVKAARARADLLAEAAGERIVRVLSMTEGGDEAPMPRVFARAAAAPAAAVPVEPGSRTLSASVTMTFELAPRETK